MRLNLIRSSGNAWAWRIVGLGIRKIGACGPTPERIRSSCGIRILRSHPIPQPLDRGCQSSRDPTRTYQASRDAVLIAASLTSPLVLHFAARHEVAGDVGKTGSRPCGGDGPAVATVAKKDRKMLPTLGGCRVLSRRAGTRERRRSWLIGRLHRSRVLKIKKSPATRAGPGSRLSSSLRSRATSLAGLIALRRRVVAAAGAALRRLVGLVHIW